MSLNSRGSTSYGFLSGFLVIFFICFIYAYLSLSDGVKNYKDNNINNSNGINYEETLKSATEKYISKYYSDLKPNNRIIVKLTTLRNYNYITLDNCKGYSIVQKLNGKNKIDSFVKCDDYTSDNYQEMYE